MAFVCVTAHAEQQYDHVHSVTVNGVEVTKPITYRQFAKVFDGRPPAIRSLVFSSCTANYDVSMGTSNPLTRLEYFQEFNPKWNLVELFKAPQPDISASGLKAKIWLEWKPVTRAKQVIRVAGMNITEVLKLENFARKFPLSYKKGTDSQSGTYEVLFGFEHASTDPESQEEAPPYTPSIQFVFHGGKLKALRVLQGLAC